MHHVARELDLGRFIYRRFVCITMGKSLDEMPHKRAERWVKSIKRYFQYKDLIYSIEVDEYDDATDDITVNLLRALSSGSLTLDVYVTIKIWNADVEHIMNGNRFGAPNVRYYEKYSPRWHTIAELEKTFEY